MLGERGEHLDNLQDKTNNLAESARGFNRSANQVRKKMWWKVGDAATYRLVEEV